jgi:hypothetical protein
VVRESGSWGAIRQTMRAMSGWKAPPGWRRTRERVFAKYGRACWRCGAYANTVDHVVAVVLGGSHDMSNHPWHRGRDRGRAVSNSRHLKLKPREPDEVEAAFRDELRKGCPHCRSRQVTGRFRAGLWDYRLSCKPGCRTFSAGGTLALAVTPR